MFQYFRNTTVKKIKEKNKERKGKKEKRKERKLPKYSSK